MVITCLDGRTEPHAELDELGPFRRSDLDPFGELVPKNPVLGLEVLDHLDEFFSVARAKSSRRGWTNLFMWIECVSAW